MTTEQLERLKASSLKRAKAVLGLDESTTLAGLRDDGANEAADQLQAIAEALCNHAQDWCASFAVQLLEANMRNDAQGAVLRRLREERDAAQLQLAQARRPLLPGGRR